MALVYGVGAIHPSAASNKPHYVGFNTTRSAADDTLFEWWSGSTVSTIKAAVDLDGKIYSAALTAGDILYGVTGGVSNVRRLDSLAIGSAGKILRSDGSIPAWSTATFPLTATQGDLLHASAANVWGSLAKGTARQVLQINAGATLPEWASALSITDLTVSNPIVGSVTGSSGSTTGNAATATALATARNINGVAFDGTTNITVTAAAGTLSGATLASGVTASSLTSVGTLAGLTVTAQITGSISGSSGSTTGNAATATALATARTINGISFDGTANITITVTAAAGTLTGATLAANVTASSLTSLGTLGSFTTNGFLTMTASASRIVPGVTSFAIRNNANSLDSLLVTDAGNVTIRGTLEVQGSGNHGWGTGAVDNVAFKMGGNVTSGGVSNFAAALQVVSIITGAPGDTTFLAGVDFQANVRTQAATESVSVIAGLRVSQPSIIDNLTGGGVITIAATVFIVSAPSQGVDNYSLYINSGNVFFPGVLTMNATVGKIVPGSTSIAFRNNADTVDNLLIRDNGDVQVGRNAALATTAVVGFLFVPGCAGTPTGNPTNDGLGAVAIVYDTTNNLLYANDGGGWVAVNSP